MATAWTNAQVVAGSGPEKEKKVSRDVVIRYQTLNFDVIATQAGGALAASDTFQALNLKAGETVINAGVNVETATTAAATGDLGFTSADVDHFVDGIALNDDGPIPAGAEGAGRPVSIVSADTLDLLINSQSAAGGRAKVWALIARL